MAKGSMGCLMATWDTAKATLLGHTPTTTPSLRRRVSSMAGKLAIGTVSSLLFAAMSMLMFGTRPVKTAGSMFAASGN